MKPHSNIQACTRLLCYDARCFRLSLQILLPALSALGRISKSSLSHWLLVGVVQWGAPAGDRREGEGMSSVVISLVPSLQSCSGLAVPWMEYHGSSQDVCPYFSFLFIHPTVPLLCSFRPWGAMSQLLVISLYSSHTSLNCAALIVLCSAGGTLIDTATLQVWLENAVIAQIWSAQVCLYVTQPPSISLVTKDGSQPRTILCPLATAHKHQYIIAHSFSKLHANNYYYFFNHAQFLSDGLII